MHDRSRFTAALSVSLVALAVAGCGNSGASSEPQSATTQTSTAAPSTASAAAAPAQKLPKTDIELNSVSQLEPIAARYTCDGANMPLPMSWSKVPPHTAELDLFVFASLPVEGKLIATWGVAHLPATLHKLAGGQLPHGAILARNSTGGTRYSLCPPKGSAVGYTALLFASSHRTKVKQGFDPEALVERDLEHTAKGEGRIYFSYMRS